MGNLRTLFMNMTPRGRFALIGSVLGIVLLAFLMFRMAAQPSYTTLMTGIDPKNTGKMTEALDEKGITYELQNNGTALAVEKAQSAQARVALAGGGLLGEGQPGFELFDEQKLGASNFQQQVTYQRALEGQLSNTLNEIDGVAGAKVSLVMPQEQLFAEEQRPTTAAVLLGSPGSSLDPAAVRGMAQLVASSVQGLKPANVTITDSTGAGLWPSGPDASNPGGGGSATMKQAAETRYGQGTQAKLQAMLDQTLGPGKAQVQVNADLNVDQARTDELTYAKKGVPLATEKEAETLKGGGTSGGAAGTPANIPSYAQGGGGATNGNYKRSSGKTNFGVDKKVTRTTVAPGAVNKLDVALVVDSSVPPAAVAQLRGAVSSAAGITPKRGDQLSVAQVAFAKPPAPQQPSAVQGAMGTLKYVGLGLAALIFLIFVGRHLRKREGETLAGEPTWLREIQAPTSLADLEQTQQFTPIASPEDQSRREVEELVNQNPERVAAQVKAWMYEE